MISQNKADLTGSDQIGTIIAARAPVAQAVRSRPPLHCPIQTETPLTRHPQSGPPRKKRSDPMNTEKVTRVYSAYSGFYDLIFGKIFQDSRLAAIDLLELKAGSWVLEVGVGTGLSLPLYPPDCRVVGVDLTGPMLRRGARRIRKLELGQVHLQQMDATHMAFRDGLFDSVMAAYVISTVPNPRGVLAEMSRVCRPGGKIVLLNHFSNGNRLVSRVEKTLSPLCTRIGFRSDLSLESLLEESGLTVLQNIRVNPFNYWHIVQCVKSGPVNGYPHSPAISRTEI